MHLARGVVTQIHTFSGPDRASRICHQTNATVEFSDFNGGLQLGRAGERPRCKHECNKDCSKPTLDESVLHNNKLRNRGPADRLDRRK